MKRTVLLFLIGALVSGVAWGQAVPCGGWHNPTSFNASSSSAGSWSARVGDRIQGSGGSTGTNVLSTCSYPNKTVIKGNANITSPALYSGNCTFTDGTCGHTFWDANDHRFQIINATNPGDAGVDIFTINAAGQGMNRIPNGHTSCIRLGDMRSTGRAISTYNPTGNDKGSEALFYTMMVTPQNALLFIDYAIVARKYDHSPAEAGEFLIRVCGKNSSTNQWNNAPLTDSLWYNVPAPHYSGALPAPWVDGRPGPAAGGTTCGYCYKPWTRVAISLMNYLYDSVRVEMYTSDCIYNVDPIYAYIAGSCQPMLITASGCPQGMSDAIDTLKAPEGLLTYKWFVSENGYSGSTGSSTIMENVPFRVVQNTSTSNVYVARLNDFITTVSDASTEVSVGDTVGVQTYKCEMFSALDPEKPFRSILYATVSNIKPVVNAEFETECAKVTRTEMHALGKVPYKGANAPKINHSYTRWVVHEGSMADTPIDTIMYGDTAVYYSTEAGDHAVVLTMYLEDSVCNTSKVFLIHVDTPPEPRIDISKRTLCENEQTTITDLTEHVSIRQWIFADTVIDSRRSGLDATVSVTRDFTEFENPFMLIVSNAADCSDTLYDTIYYFHDPDVYFSEDTVICNGHESHVKVTTPVQGCTFAWYRHKNREGETPICTGDVLYVRPTAPRTKYYLKITAEAGCVAWDSVTLSLLSTSITMTPKHGKHCPKDSVTLEGNGALWYEWSSYPADPDLESQQHNRTITVSPHEDTRYYLVGYAADSCDIAAINVLVQEVPIPIPDVEYNPGFIDTETPVVNFTDLSKYRSHTKWEFGDGGISTGEQVTHYFDIYTDSCNYVTMTTYNEIGCSDDTSFSIVIDTFGFYPPNVFTPNKAENNVFSIASKSKMDDFHIYIFNRQGALVYTSEDINFKWDGTHNGRPCPQGSYPYVITYTRAGSVSIYRIKGTVTLLR